MMDNTARYLLIGGGVTTAAAAQAIRETDKEGRIVILCAEMHPPYDRPPLSKQYLLDDSWKTDDPYSKADNFYPDNHVEFRVGSRVASIDRDGKTATLQDGTVWTFEKLLLATGSTPLHLNLPGHDTTGVYLLRTIEDAENVRTAIRASKRGVCVGAGYLGLEVASAATKRGVQMTVIERESQPWPRFAGERVGGFLRRYFESQRVRFVFDTEVTGFTGEHVVSSVTTNDGQEFPGDFAVVGVGISLNIELAQEAGLEVDPASGVLVNEYLQTSDPAIYAAGDIACFHDIAMGRTWHAEHHLNAKWQGQAVGRILAGGDAAYDRVPYFYSDVFDLHLCLRGDTQPPSDAHTILYGDLDGAEFAELKHDAEGVLRGATICSRDEPKMDAISDVVEELIRGKVNIKAREAEITRAGFDLASLK